MDRVREYYANFGEREWDRLETPGGALEFAVNIHFLHRHLPTGSRVLDIGGGPGRYAIWLAERGHRVVLADLSSELLDSARRRISASPSSEKVEAVVEADARDLSSWQDCEFDAALSLGPFYHLTDAVERAQAVRELFRVIRPGGKVFIALMPRYTLYRRTISIADERHRVKEPEFVNRLLRHGVFTNDVAGRFDNAYGAAPAEIAPYFESFGFESITLAASEGLGSGIENDIAMLKEHDRAAYEQVMKVVIEAAPDPALHGTTSHLLYVATRR